MTTRDVECVLLMGGDIAWCGIVLWNNWSSLRDGEFGAIDSLMNRLRDSNKRCVNVLCYYLLLFKCYVTYVKYRSLRNF